jgi:hypothetical protein
VVPGSILIFKVSYGSENFNIILKPVYQNKSNLNYRKHVFQDGLCVAFERKQEMFNRDGTQQLFPGLTEVGFFWPAVAGFNRHWTKSARRKHIGIQLARKR